MHRLGEGVATVGYYQGGSARQNALTVIKLSGCGCPGSSSGSRCLAAGGHRLASEYSSSSTETSFFTGVVHLVLSVLASCVLLFLAELLHTLIRPLSALGSSEQMHSTVSHHYRSLQFISLDGFFP